MANHMSYKKLHKLVKDLEEQGCRVRPTAVGYVLYFPNGASTAIHKTPSDYRAMRNMRAFVRRQGLSWPLDPQ